MRLRRLGDEGLTMVELLVSLLLMSIFLGAFFALYVNFAKSSVNTVNYSEQQGQVRNVVRVLDADLRSADPLTLVPASFLSAVTLPSATVTSPGANDATPTDVIAMYEVDDRYDPCPTSSSTTTTVPTPYESSHFAANVVWAYDSSTGTLTRYSFVPANSGSTGICKTGGWIAGMSLADVVNANGTMFAISQGSSSLTQATTPTSTTIPNQAAPVCGVSVTVTLSLDAKSTGQQIPLHVRSTVPLPNEPALLAQAC
ncbi:MAG TPA: hypothetical protein VKU92_07200 [Acidimicrobiales bacterium]|nr:hypothetical protein [Acidimicrobiales bacterium]